MLLLFYSLRNINRFTQTHSTIFPKIWEYGSLENTCKIYSEVVSVMTFDPLWKTLKAKKISQYELLNKYKMSRGMLDNLKHNRSITLNTLDDLCTMLDCDITDIIEYKKD